MPQAQKPTQTAPAEAFWPDRWKHCPEINPLKLDNFRVLPENSTRVKKLTRPESLNLLAQADSIIATGVINLFTIQAAYAK